ncbi:PH domain-containing protein [Pseudarthrobacter sp. N5]|uniref:PH domain-containing protein n=1 Tax=Pseudarthrobacter sp. N5 TaxID=3418416 RepID=UPI003CF0C534
MRKGLQSGEQVIVMTRPQPRRLILPAVVFVLAPAAAAFAAAWIIRGEPTRLLPLVSREWTLWLVTACVLAAAWVLCGYCLPRLLSWQGTRYTLTSRRIVARYGMLRRTDRQVSLAAVRHVTVSQSVLQRILRSGNISLETRHEGNTVIADVPEIARFRDFVLDALDDLPDGEIFETDDLSGYTDEVLPGELREGGSDER